MTVSETRREEIVSALKRCSDETVQVAFRFEVTRDPAAVPTIIFGILTRELPKESASRLSSAPGTTRLIEGLGLDSLGLMEAVMSVEEVLGITIDNSELRKIATLDDLNGFIREKLESRS